MLPDVLLFGIPFDALYSVEFPSRWKVDKSRREYKPRRTFLKSVCAPQQRRDDDELRLVMFGRKKKHEETREAEKTRWGGRFRV